MHDDPTAGIGHGDTLETAMLSPCVGGLVRTWTETGTRLWGVADPAALTEAMGRGQIARTLREDRRFREVALLHEASGTLLLQGRRPRSTTDDGVQVEAREIRLIDPGAGAPTASPWTDLHDRLAEAVRHTLDVDGFLVVELGGWDAPPEPYCLFLVVHEDDDISVIEAAPAPIGARFWEASLRPGAAGATLSTRATDDTLAVVPTLIVDACATWGVDPWDLAFTYGVRE